MPATPRNCTHSATFTLCGRGTVGIAHEIRAKFYEQGGETSVIVVHERPPPSCDPVFAPAHPIFPRLVNPVLLSLRSPMHYEVHDTGIVLTDNYNPIDFYDSWLKECVRRSILDSTEWDALIASGPQNSD